MLTEKWVVTYKEKDGKDGMGMCNDKKELPKLIEMVLARGGSEIKIKDESIRIKAPKMRWRFSYLVMEPCGPHSVVSCTGETAEELFDAFNKFNNLKSKRPLPDDASDFIREMWPLWFIKMLWSLEFIDE